MTSPQIRKAVEADIPNLLPLNRELAEFEKYASDFAVTEEVLREQGFRRSPPDFHCLIAEEAGELVGFLVYYFVPFTYRAKPNLIIKELYIAGRHRSRGVGKLLMKAVA
jgi:GNAT superfamily N-acetyltransferase